MDDSQQRKAIARALLAADVSDVDEDALVLAGTGLRAPAEAVAPFPFPYPTASPRFLVRLPRRRPRTPRCPPPTCSCVTWTAAEHKALADVFTRGHPRDRWYPYDRRFADHYAPLIRRGAPALAARRLGSWFPVSIGQTTLVLVKSELHLNQDGISTGDGTATMPVADLFRQLIAEVQPKVVLSIGTAGAVYEDHELGDVVVTRAARFRLTQEFKNEAFNGVTYRSDWAIPSTHLGHARTRGQPDALAAGVSGASAAPGPRRGRAGGGR